MTKNKRVALTLPPEIDSVLTELSSLSNQPKTAIITEILTDSLPIFSTVIDALKAVKEGQNQIAIDAAAKFLQDASNSINQAHIDFGGIKAKHGDQ